MVGITEKGGTWTTAQHNFTVGVRGPAIEAAWEDWLSKLGVDNEKICDVIRRQAIRKTPELSDIILWQFHVATHMSPGWALHALAHDISDTNTERFNLYKNSWAQWVDSHREARIQKIQFMATGQTSEAAWGGGKETLVQKSGPVRIVSPRQSRNPSCHASQNRGEVHQRWLPPKYLFHEWGWQRRRRNVHYTMASGKTAWIAVLKGLRKKSTRPCWSTHELTFRPAILSVIMTSQRIAKLGAAPTTSAPPSPPHSPPPLP